MVMRSPRPLRHGDRVRPSWRLSRRLPWALVVALACCACVAAGCAKPRAETLVVGPPLEVPPPPPRALAPVELEVASATAGAPPAVAPQPGAPVSPSDSSGGAPRRSAAPASTPEPPAVTVAEEPPREFRVVSSADDAALERRVIEVLNRARTDLMSVQKRLQQLSPAERKNFEQAQSHLQLAEAARKESNLMYALKLGEASAEVAGQLVRAR